MLLEPFERSKIATNMPQPARKGNMSCHLSTHKSTQKFASGVQILFSDPIATPQENISFLSATFLPAFSIRYASPLHAQIHWTQVYDLTVYMPLHLPQYIFKLKGSSELTNCVTLEAWQYSSMELFPGTKTVYFSEDSSFPMSWYC